MSENILGLKKFLGMKKFWVWRKLLVFKSFGSEKNVGKTKILVKKLWVKKKFCVWKKNLCPKKKVKKKIWVKKNIGKHRLPPMLHHCQNPNPEVYILQMEQVYFPNFFFAHATWKPKKFEFQAQTPLIITFYCIFKL